MGADIFKQLWDHYLAQNNYTLSTYSEYDHDSSFSALESGERYGINTAAANDNDILPTRMVA